MLTRCSWDDWVPPERLRRYTEENIDLASQLKREMEALRRPTPKLPPHPNKKSGKGSGSTGGDYNSARASEERHSSVQAPSGPRGQKRGRDFEIEKVRSGLLSFCVHMAIAWPLLNQR